MNWLDKKSTLVLGTHIVAHNSDMVVVSADSVVLGRDAFFCTRVNWIEVILLEKAVTLGVCMVVAGRDSVAFG